MKPSSSDDYSAPRYLVAGEKALVVEFGSRIDPATNARVLSLDRAIARHPIFGVSETVPSFRSLLVFYDPLAIGFDELASRLQALETGNPERRPAKAALLIPTVYGGEFGPDIDHVARHSGISVEDVIRLHLSGNYVVYMIGFTPGFPYLGGLPDQLATARLQVPRTRVPAGSVGIAGNQTGVYPVDSPGGWQLIGRTPLRLYDRNRADPVLLKPGDSVRFERIDEAQFWEMHAAVR